MRPLPVTVTEELTFTDVSKNAVNVVALDGTVMECAMAPPSDQWLKLFRLVELICGELVEMLWELLAASESVVVAL
jgi:hypothetical protein